MFKTRGIEKLKKILINDKHLHPSFFADLIRSEMFKSLSNYMELSPDDVLVNISIDEKGEYVLRLKAKCQRLRIMGILPKGV